MKHIIDKTRLSDALMKTSLAAVMLELSVWITPFTKRNEPVRYVQQGMYFVTVILTVIAFLAIKRLIPGSLRRAIMGRLMYAIRKMASRVASISRKILSVFGIKLDRFKRRKDEKSFVFGEEDEEGGRRRRHSIKSSSKWRDMNENAEKIRFLYIKYIVKVIKGGYKFHASLTPNEVRGDLGIEKEQAENELFDLYNGARYSGGSVFITDEQVESTMALVNGKKK